MAISKQVYVEDVRLSFVYVNEPYVFKDDATKEPKYCVTPMIPKENKEVYKLCEEAVDAVIQEAVSQNVISTKQAKAVKRPMRDGTEQYNTEQKGEEFEGMWFFAARTSRQPGIVNEYGESLHTRMDENGIKTYPISDVYSGIWAVVDVNFFFTTSGGKPRVAVALNNIMKLRDDERLDSMAAPAEKSFKKYFKQRPKKTGPFDKADKEAAEKESKFDK